MITVNNVSLQFGGAFLFKDVNLKFTRGNCYGIIGANGAGKSTFLKILSGEKDTTTGNVSYDKDIRVSVLKQDQFAYDGFSVLDTIIMGNRRLYEIIKQKEALYAKPDFSDADGVLAGELESEFAEMNGWDAESDAAKLLQMFSLDVNLLYSQMSALSGNDKVKVLLSQALFGNPDVLLLDEPTNHLDIYAKNALEDFLLEYEGTVIVVSHDRHFLNTVCTHIVDIDYSQMRIYVGNYDFWLESSQLIQQMMKDQKAKNEEKAERLKSFIQRFAANKSKAKQATSRKKLLEKLDLSDLPASSRKTPYVNFALSRELGKEVLEVTGLTKTVDGGKVLNNVSFRMERTDKIAVIGSDAAVTALFKILAGELQPDKGTFKWGVSTNMQYYPKDNGPYFDGCNLDILSWIAQYGKANMVENEYRGFLARMLFGKDDVFKKVKVLSGGEKVRCMLSKMMIKEANALMLDQPTNHLDLEAITAVNNALIEFKGAVMFATHDHEFAQTIANRILVIDEKGGISSYVMSYDDFIIKNAK